METNNKLREALMEVQRCANGALMAISHENVPIQHMWDIIYVCKAALAEPVKNCEVGTAEELYERYEKFCCSHFNNEGDNCLKCPFSQPTCKFAWAQMPYKEGGAK